MVRITDHLLKTSLFDSKIKALGYYIVHGGYAGYYFLYHFKEKEIMLWSDGVHHTNITGEIQANNRLTFCILIACTGWEVSQSFILFSSMGLYCILAFWSKWCNYTHSYVYTKEAFLNAYCPWPFISIVPAMSNQLWPSQCTKLR